MSHMACFFFILCSTVTAGVADAQVSQGLAAMTKETWHKAMIRTPLPSNGCFTGTFPTMTWQSIPCQSPPNVPSGHMHGSDPETVGNAYDFVASATGITSAEGTFPNVSGVTSETDSINNRSNSFSLQVNTNSNFSTSACNGHSGCTGWQQFLFTNNFDPSACTCTTGCTWVSQIYIQYWLINYGATCPASWNSFNGSCFKNSSATNVAIQTIGNLATVSLTGSANSAQDVVHFFDGSTGTISAQGADSVLGLSGRWTNAEFNVFGAVCGSEANIAPTTGVTVVVSDQITTAASSVSCIGPSGAGSTGEMNSLDLMTSSCCTMAGSQKAMYFAENSTGGTGQPYCTAFKLQPILSLLR